MQAVLCFEKVNQLPLELRESTQNGSVEVFSPALNAYLNSGDYTCLDVLDTIYQIDNEYVRPALLNILRTAPLKPNYFQRIRYIFKVAEYRHDAEVFKILAYRFETEKAVFCSDKYYVRLPDSSYLRQYEYKYDPVTRNYKQELVDEIQKEIQRPNPRMAYSNKTREYLRRRV